MSVNVINVCVLVNGGQHGSLFFAQVLDGDSLLAGCCYYYCNTAIFQGVAFLRARGQN